MSKKMARRDDVAGIRGKFIGESANTADIFVRGGFCVVDYKEGDGESIILIIQSPDGKQFEFKCNNEFENILE